MLQWKLLNLPRHIKLWCKQRAEAQLFTPHTHSLPILLVLLLVSMFISRCSGLEPRRRKIDQPPLEWESFFTPEEYDLFSKLVHAYFEDQGIGITIQDGAVIVQSPDSFWQDMELGLTSLAQLCNQYDQGDWSTLISGHFDSIRVSELETEDLLQKIHNFSEISDLLAVRLWPTDYLASIGSEHLVYREDLEGILSVLVFDLPHSIRQVKPEEAAYWDIQTQDLFDLGLQNVRRLSVPEISRIEIKTGVEIILLSGESYLVTTHALFLEEHAQCMGAKGALVGIPHRHALLCYPIENLRVVNAINALIPLIDRLYIEGPGSISPYLYWYHDGQFTNLPYTMADNKLSFIPPTEFVELLNSLEE